MIESRDKNGPPEYIIFSGDLVNDADELGVAERAGGGACESEEDGSHERGGVGLVVARRERTERMIEAAGVA